MTDIMNANSDPARLEQLAEEAAELAQAAIKLARKKRGESPTPKSEMQCLDALTEEIGDVLACLDEVMDIVDMERVEAVKAQKKVRWRLRIDAQKGGIK